LLSSHDKGQEREEPYEATSLMYGFEAAAGRMTGPPTVTVGHRRRCLNCARHCPCPDPQLVGEDEADEPEVVGLNWPAR
jgi:hypothetical protein